MSRVTKKAFLLSSIFIFCAVLFFYELSHDNNMVKSGGDQPVILENKGHYSSELVETRNSVEWFGYLGVGVFGEQIESAMYDLYQLADLAESWKMKLAEPSVHKSKFHCPLSLEYQWTLGNLFNMRHLNDDFKKHFHINYDLIISSLDILKDHTLSNTLILLHWTAMEVPSTKRCAKLSHSYMATHAGTKTWRMLSKRNVIAICLQQTRRINFRELLKDKSILKLTTHKARQNKSKFLIFFTSWNGIRTKPDIFFYFDPDFHQRHYGYSPHSVTHSLEVLESAKELKNTLKLKPPYLGVHVRLERLIRHKLSHEGLTRCVSSLMSSIRQLMHNHSINDVVTFTDYKTRGSSTCSGVHCAGIAKQLGIGKQLKTLGVVNPTLSVRGNSLKRESGFVANVEQEVLSQARYLVLVGFGSFQGGIIGRHIKHHNISTTSLHTNHNIFRICHF